MKHLIKTVLFFFVSLSISCEIPGIANLDKSKKTIAQFYHKLNTSDYDSLNTIFSQQFLEKSDQKDAINQINIGRKVWGKFEKYEYTEVRSSTENKCNLTAYVHYANQANVERYVLVLENDTMKILSFVINP